MGDKHAMTINSSRNRRTPFIDYSQAIANVKRDLQEEIDVLDNRIVFISNGLATLSYYDPDSFATSTTKTLSGTTAGAAFPDCCLFGCGERAAHELAAAAEGAEAIRCAVHYPNGGRCDCRARVSCRSIGKRVHSRRAAISGSLTGAFQVRS